MAHRSHALLLVEVAVEALSLDAAPVSTPEAAELFEHLVRYCAHFDPLPAVTIEIDANGIRVTRGHDYLRVARCLGRPTVRAVVASPRSSDAVEAFLRRDDVMILDWDAIDAAEVRDPRPRGWHVVFFRRALSVDEKMAFDREIVALFPDGARAIHDDAGPAAEIEATTPVTDHAWATELLAAMITFSRNRAEIASYQGRRFGPFDATPEER